MTSNEQWMSSRIYSSDSSGMRSDSRSAAKAATKNSFLSKRDSAASFRLSVESMPRRRNSSQEVTQNVVTSNARWKVLAVVSGEEGGPSSEGDGRCIY